MTQYLNRFTPLVFTLMLAGAGLFTAPGTALSGPTTTPQQLEKTAQLCTEQTAKLEQSEDIPLHLLTAISLAETGRWQKSSEEILAWPWTVTANGQGQHFDSKVEALAEVEILVTQGVENIDVGCMQVNLKYHNTAFETLSQALDPATNTRYAAQFLKKLYAPHKDWMKAVGNYHSSTPDKNLKYRAKLVRLWNKTRAIQGQPTLEVVETVSENKNAAMREIDYQRINSLNAAFQARRAADPVASSEKDRFMQAAMKRHEELNSWRQAQVQGIEMKHLLEMRRAEQKLRERKELLNRDKPSFEERRREQLGEWRESNLWTPK